MLFETNIYELEKTIWTDADFEKMGWHDSSVYALSFINLNNSQGNDLCFDLDYIFKWVHPKPNQHTFSFWVSPCTLIFHDVFDLKIDIESGLISNLELEIADIIRLEPASPDIIEEVKWKIELQSGNIQFDAKGFTQIVRKKPLLKGTQNLTLDERGGVSFEKISFK